MNFIRYFLIIFILLKFINAYARDCPGDMILWQSPYSLTSDCICNNASYKLSTNLSSSYNAGSSVNLPPSPNFSSLSTLGPATIGNCLSSCVYPNQISGSNLILWLDANDPNGNGTKPLIGSAVSSWKDKSSFLQSIIFSSALTFVKYFGNLNALSGSSSSTSINLGASITSSQFTIFVVANNQLGGYFTNPTNVGNLFPSTGCSMNLNWSGSSLSFTYSNSTLSLIPASNIGSIQIINYSPTSQNLWSIAPSSMYMNNNAQTYIVNANSSISPTPCSNNTFIYNSAIFNNNLEIIIYNKSLSAAEQAQIIYYLQTKWSGNGCT